MEREFKELLIRIAANQELIMHAQRVQFRLASISHFEMSKVLATAEGKTTACIESCQRVLK